VDSSCQEEGWGNGWASQLSGAIPELKVNREYVCCQDFLVARDRKAVQSGSSQKEILLIHKMKSPGDTYHVKY
jgi:hypothetical protein